MTYSTAPQDSDGRTNNPVVDRNLLAGVISLQLNLITRDQLVNAMVAWTLHKEKKLEDILKESGQITDQSRNLITSVLDQYLKDGSENVLASLSGITISEDLRQSLDQINDPELQFSIQQFQRDGQTRFDAAVEPSQTKSNLSEGRQAGRFQILRAHKDGGLGSVSVALDKELNREVALKNVQSRYARNQSAQDRLRIEAEITGGLEHPGIVPVYGLGQFNDGSPFYCMRFIKGDSLKDAIRAYHQNKANASISEKNLELRSLLRRFLDVCNAIGYAHSRKVLHRDLKPGNIMLGKFGETLVVDWGLAKAQLTASDRTDASETPIVPRSGSTAAPTMMGAAIGTPEFMSPEQAAGKLDQLGPATDVYSLGATLYAILTGKPPVSGKDSDAKICNAMRGDFLPPIKVDRTIPPALNAVCMKAMSLNPDDRYASARDLSNEIELWLADEPISSFREPFDKRVLRVLRKNQTLTVSVAGVLVTAVIGLAATAYVIKQKNEQVSSWARTTEDLALGLIRDAEDNLSQLPGLTGFRKKVTQESIVAFEKIFESNPDEIETRLKLAELYLISANLHRTSREQENAEKRYQQALGLVEPEPKSVERVSALESILNLEYSRFLNGHNEAEKADERLASALKSVNDGLSRFPNSISLQRTLARVLNERSTRLARSGSFEEARADLSKSIDAFKQVSASDEAIGRDNQLLTSALLNQAELEREYGDLSVAFSAAESLVKEPSEIENEGDRHFRARALLEFSLIKFSNEGDLKTFDKEIGEAISNWSRLVEDFPSNMYYKRYLARAAAFRGFAKSKLELPYEDDFELSKSQLMQMEPKTSGAFLYEKAYAECYYYFFEVARSEGDDDATTLYLSRCRDYLNRSLNQVPKDGTLLDIQSKLMNF